MGLNVFRSMFSSDRKISTVVGIKALTLVCTILNKRLKSLGFC